MIKNSLFLSFLATSILFTSCARFKDLQKDLDKLDATYSLTGKLTEPTSKPVRAAVWEKNAEGVIRVVDVASVGEGGAFGFLVPPSNHLYVAVFEDTNNNETFDKGERGWVYGKPSPVPFKDGRSGMLDVVLGHQIALSKADITALKNARAGRTYLEMNSGNGVKIGLGDVASLDESRFSTESGITGLWKPATYLLEGGFGVYALRKYDSGKIPVLFVHGAEGSPQDLRTPMETLDKKRFQPWFFAYPSGLRLDENAEALNKAVEFLHQRHGFDKMYVVAHSMGGLMTRAFIIKNVVRDKHSYLKKFVTISTPWNGHPGAVLGVKRAPTVVPSWRDVEPDSEFIEEIFKTKLRDRVDISLFFGFRAEKKKGFLPYSNDGSVSVVSEMDYRAQKEAQLVAGFDEDHMSILKSPTVMEKLDEVLKTP